MRRPDANIHDDPPSRFGFAFVIGPACLVAALCALFFPAAADAFPRSTVLTEFGDTWSMARAPLGEPPEAPDPPAEKTAENPDGDEKRSTEAEGWSEGEAPFLGYYSTRARRRSSATQVDLDDMEPLPADPWARSDEEVSGEEAFYFVRHFAVSSPDDVTSLLFEARFIGGFVVYLNGQEILRHRVDMTNRYHGFAASDEMPAFVREGRRASGQRAFRGLDPSALVEGQNTLLVRVQRRPGNADRTLLFDGRLEAFREPGFIKGPYLQNATPHTVTIMFETTTISTPWIDYGDGSSLTESATAPSTGGTLHEVTLTGLEPDTRYFYRVRAEQIWPETSEQDASLASDIFYFHTAPGNDAEFTFIAYGDNRSQPAVHTALIERMLAEDAAFVINTGDLTESGVDYRQWQEEFFEPARPLTYYLPMWTALGNHDGNHISYFEMFSLPGNESWYSFRYGIAELFALNTVYDLDPDSEQYQWFEQALAASDASWKVVFFHHPPFACTPSRLPGFGPVRKHMVPLFEEYGVELVVSGHDHLYAHGEQNGVHYVISGGGGAWTYPTQVEPPNIFCEQVHHYTVIQVEEHTLYLRAIDVDGAEVDAFAIRK